MRDEHRPHGRLRWLAAVLGVAATLGAALLVDVSAANASVDQAAQAMPDRTVEDRIDQGLVVYSAQPKADPHRTAPTAIGPTAVPYVVVGPSPGKSGCFRFEVCLWTGPNFTGFIAAFGGDYNRCQGWRFEGTPFQDDVASIWNRASGPVSIWNRASDGSFNYRKFALLPSGYEHSTTQFSFIMDAWVYDPGNNCSRLDLIRL